MSDRSRDRRPKLFRLPTARHRLRREIERDGEVLRVRGTVKDHPALKHELANRAFVVRTLARLGLNFEPVKPSVGRPGSSIGWSPP